MDVNLTAGVTAPLPGGDPAGKPKNAAEAAQQFEALLIGQMLRAAHAEGEQDSAGDTMWDMAAQQFARVLSKNGGLGLAQMIEKGLDVPHLEGKAKLGYTL
jgi:Rod binding domain-containing protein